MDRMEEYNERGCTRECNGDTFEEVVARRLSRRSMLRGALSALPLVVLGANELTGGAKKAAAQQAASGLTFSPVSLARNDDFINVPENHQVSLVAAWGNPVTAGARELDLANQNGESQSTQFGYNCDFVGYCPLPDYNSGNSSLGLLVVNFEYTNPELMFLNYRAASASKDQVDAEIAAHGIGVVEVQRTGGTWSYNANSRYNRRLTGFTPMEITGPAAGHEMMRTSADPTGRRVLGTLNNCAGGKTPWGTVLSAEENFNQYFANANSLPAGSAARNAATRYGLPGAASSRRWETYYDRFDLAKEPNEVNRFGWIVEFDPYDPNSVPKKRTALGRTKHEAATIVVANDGRVVAYSGDDERFDYVYKFVTNGRYDANNRAANLNLLDEGTLYVAKYNADGTGQWIPLVWGQNGLTPENGFRDQGEVLIHCRQAGDRVGATRMDRPEDIENNPVTGKVYVVCTNNTNRSTSGANAVDAANPRANNRNGHIIEMVEEGNNHAALTFRWEIFMLCGNPGNPEEQRTFFAGYNPAAVSPLCCPDNIVFDRAGNMWIGTDGMPGVWNVNDAVYAVACEGPERGLVKQFLSVPAGAEVCGPEFTPDNSTLFVAVQHPGEGGAYGGNTVSRWPYNTDPARPGVIAVTKLSGSPIIGSS